MKNLLFLTIFLVFSGCAFSPDISEANKRIIAENSSYFASDEQLLSDQDDQAKKMLSRRYSVWQEKYSFDVSRISWQFEAFIYGKGFGQNLQLLDQRFFDELNSSAKIWEYPNENRLAISKKPLKLRSFPTDKPYFKDFSKAGEGYPFDYNQNSSLHPSYPLRVTHKTVASDWLFVESDHAHGWVKPDEIELISPQTAEYLADQELFVVLSDQTHIYDMEDNYLFSADIGTLLFADKNAPISIKNGKIVPTKADKQLSKFPLKNSKKVVADQIDKMIGTPYGWGGYYGGRDCSSLMRDIFVPFGLFLPRNSREQREHFWEIDLRGLSKDEKIAQIREKAVPFETLINFPGHVGLFVGFEKNDPLILHASWGLKIKTKSYEDRLIIGKTAITSLLAGKNLDYTNLDGLISRAISMSYINKQAEENSLLK